MNFASADGKLHGQFLQLANSLVCWLVKMIMNNRNYNSNICFVLGKIFDILEQFLKTVNFEPIENIWPIANFEIILDLRNFNHLLNFGLRACVGPSLEC